MPSPAASRSKKLPATWARVRCLGPARKEHTFLSADATRERVCQECRRLQQKRRVSPTAEYLVSWESEP